MIMRSYLAGGGIRGLVEDGLIQLPDELLYGQDDYADEEGAEFEVHEGKQYKRIAIEGEENEYYMDMDGNIYDLDFKEVGRAGDDDEEEA